MKSEQEQEAEIARILNLLFDIVEPAPLTPVEASTWRETGDRPIDLRKRY
jgi:hypothetical protein